MQFNKKIVLFDIDYTLFDTKAFKKSQLKKCIAYDEVHEVLTELKKIAILGIFSEGEINLQRTKLRKSNLQKYFKEEHVHIVPDKLAEIKRVLDGYKNKQIFFVDDKLTILRDANTVLPSIFAIWLKRGIYAMNQKKIANFKPNAVVANLREVVRIVKSHSSVIG